MGSLEPIDAAMILNSMDGGVRNPSAFITRAVNDRLNGKIDLETMRWSHISSMAEEIGLDERAENVLKELPATEAYRVLDNLKGKGAGVNNPSAYVLGAVSGIQKEFSMGPPAQKRRRM